MSNILLPNDFANPVDFTGSGSWSGALIDQAFDGIEPNPQEDDVKQGLGMVITTVDVELDTPVVPDPTESVDYNKWVRYIWNRIPNAAAPNPQAIVYAWNDAVDSDATYLKWVSTREDITALQTAVTQNAADIITATSTANSAQANAVNALNTANAANTTATNAANSVASATAAASAASTAATTALNTANAANTTANAANATANNALTIAQAGNNIGNIAAGTKGQRIRTNYSTPAALQYYNEEDCIAIIGEQQNSGVDAAIFANASSAFTNRVLNTTLKDSGNLIQSLTGNAFKPVAGVYRIDAIIPCSHPTVSRSFVCQLYNNTAGAAVATTFGNTVFAILQTVGICRLTGTFTTDGTNSYLIRTAMSGTNTTTNGGQAAGIVGIKENYTLVTLTLIG